MRVLLITLVAIAATCQVQGQNTMARLQQLQQEAKNFQSKIDGLRIRDAEWTSFVRKTDEEDRQRKISDEHARTVRIAAEDSARALKRQQAIEDLKKQREANDLTLAKERAENDQEYAYIRAEIEAINEKIRIARENHENERSWSEWDHEQAKQEFEQKHRNNQWREKQLDDELAALKREREQVEYEQQQEQQQQEQQEEHVTVTHTVVRHE